MKRQDFITVEIIKVGAKKELDMKKLEKKIKFITGADNVKVTRHQVFGDDETEVVKSEEM